MADYYKLTEADLANLDMNRVNREGEPILLGEVVAKKLMVALEESKTRSFARVLFGLGIRHVGKTTAELIVHAVPFARGSFEGERGRAFCDSGRRARDR